MNKSDLISAIQIEISKFTNPEEVQEFEDCTSLVEKLHNIQVPENISSCSEINENWSLIFAERVHFRVKLNDNVKIRTSNKGHSWIEYENMCYDAKHINGIKKSKYNK